MRLYNIIWLIIFVGGGVSSGILGLSELNYFLLLLVNSYSLDRISFALEQLLIKRPLPKVIPVMINAEASI